MLFALVLICYQDPFSSNNVTMDDILPQSFWLSSYPSPLESLSKVQPVDTDSTYSASNPAYTKQSSPQTYNIKPASPQDHSAKAIAPQPSISQPSHVFNSDYQQKQPSWTSCTCFQQNADLLCTLKKTSTSSTARELSLGLLLPTVQDALKAWRSLIECRSCSTNAEQEILLLAFMTIRILLVRVQGQMTDDPDQANPPPSHSPDSQRRQSSRSNIRQTTSPARHAARVTIGDHELGDRDRWLVTQFMLLNTVRRIKAAVQRFQELLERKTKPTMVAGGTLTPAEFEVGYDQVAQMLRNLSMKVASLEKELERGN